MTNVQATVVDSDGQAWFGGTWSLIFIPNPNDPVVTHYNINGTPLSPSVITQSGVMDANGHFNLSLYDSTTITPSGSSWRLTVCPQASSQCGFYNFTTTSANIDISGALSFLLPPPRFLGVYPNYGYSDVEVIPSKAPGSTYFNVTSQCQRYYIPSSSSWSCVTFQPAVPVPPTFPLSQCTFTNLVIIGNASNPIAGLDLNTMTTGGFYFLEQPVANDPPDPDPRGYYLMVLSAPTQFGPGGVTLQMVWNFNINAVWYRQYRGDTQVWTVWHQFTMSS